MTSRDEKDFLGIRRWGGPGREGISVRLALFTEMIKGKPWTPATFREVGGTKVWV